MFQPLSPSVSPHPYQVLPVEWTAAQRCHTIISVLLFQAGWIHSYSATGRKQAQDPPGSLHTIVSSVEWSSLKGRGPRWPTLKRTTCFTNMPHVCAVVSLTWCQISPYPPTPFTTTPPTPHTPPVKRYLFRNKLPIKIRSGPKQGDSWNTWNTYTVHHLAHCEQFKYKSSNTPPVVIKDTTLYDIPSY